MTIDLARMTPEQIRAEAERRQRLRDRGAPLDAPDPAITLTPEQFAEQERRETTHWKQEQSACRKVFVAIGCAVYWLSQSRRTGQTPGLGDLWVFAPEGWELAWWWETKSGRGELSDAQERFRDLCVRRKVLHGSGNRYDAREFVIKLGLAYVGPGNALEPVRRSHT
jgi:hypothetical protein